MRSILQNLTKRLHAFQDFQKMCTMWRVASPRLVLVFPSWPEKRSRQGCILSSYIIFFQDLAFQPTTQSRSSSMISGYSLIFPRKRSRVSGPFHVCFSRIECAGVYCVHQYVHRPLADLWFTLDTHTYFYEWPRRSHPCKNISMAFSLPPPYGRR